MDHCACEPINHNHKVASDVLRVLSDTVGERYTYQREQNPPCLVYVRQCLFSTRSDSGS